VVFLTLNFRKHDTLAQLSSPEEAIRLDSAAAIAGILSDDDTSRLSSAVADLLKCGAASALVGRLGDSEGTVAVHAVGALR